ncbi:Dabb family protein [Nocardia cyriacigeorgica]|uniref:Dabb family protein n=1 Tax=Nocardia cyriacigeorgica TaxID=135487 RepID=A0A6P1DHM1_9NOCA|nr:Dabb family protein [Nocardia cyriacigeorgica]NEW42655.1 Dabb family protein [Nocardia cyriacigeorgica]NEW48073.1 Dabb family protein [Nocardia cyriacigeorgica]NEW51480.1 Dabb family protein [Nocardia cyriacigeorgica]NEW59360.1 Dabb family protein [Nocardia cyriacigeorgica]
MSEVVHLVHLTEPSRRDELAAEVRGLVEPHARRTLIAATLPGGIDAGDLIVRLRFADESGRRAAEEVVDRWSREPSIERVETATFTGTPTPGRHSAAPSVYRVLLVAVDPHADRALVDRFETETAAMPDYIHAIGTSLLSRAGDPGGHGWTHIWEQEFTDIDGLTGPYMTHPYHWAHIDRWFDPEHGTKIVNRLCHSFCALDTALLSSS